ncbi:hypothetical protein Mal65_10940 [Crateriforma conspicua]|nr:hypothetical protein Mal65_10940 [Crateriforma conspicua]
MLEEHVKGFTLAARSRDVHGGVVGSVRGEGIGTALYEPANHCWLVCRGCNVEWSVTNIVGGIWIGVGLE